MKRYAQINFYDLLEIPSTASADEIRKGYELAKKTYSEDSMVTYSLFDDDSREEVMQRIEEAFRVLGDRNRRAEYDAQIGVKPPASSRPSHREEEPEQPPEKAEAPVPVPGQDPRGDEPSLGAVEKTDLRPDQVSGQRLKEVRERLGVPLQEIADRTRINITYLDFVEKDNFRSLPAAYSPPNYPFFYTICLKISSFFYSSRERRAGTGRL